MPIVLTTNDVVLNPDHVWNDIEGVQYHYPNQYKNKIRPGDSFVYYRGVHRPGGRRGEAEYFGQGRIGAVRPDPNTVGRSRPSWFCAIEDYVPFAPPVPAKPDGVHYETILQNMWRNGVRDLDEETFGRIAAAAGAFSERGAVEPQIIAPMGATEADDLIVPRGRAVGATGVGYRKSTRAKEIGDWAELEVVTFLRALGSCVDIVHRAAQRETPGWDIDYRDSGGGLHRVEVKGTVAAAFTTIDLTARELQAARQHGEGFWLFLVAHCLTDRPRIQRIRDPAARLASGAWTATPSLYSIALG